MNRVSVFEPYKLSIEEVSKPKMESGFAIIKMEYCGICGSDISIYKGSNPTCKYPILGLGHEGVGVIDEICDNDKGLKTGDRVVIEPFISCGKCSQCIKGNYNNCENLKVSGTHTFGMMSNYYKHPFSLLHKIPDKLSFEKAALVEPFSIGLHASSRVGVTSGDICLILGCGVIGIMVAFSVIHYGGIPLLVDVADEKLIKAQNMGLENTCNSSKRPIIDFINEKTGNKLADVIIDTTGSPSLLKDLHLYCGYGAKIGLVGWPKTSVEINTIRLMQKEATIFTSRNSKNKFPEALKLIDNGFLPTEKIVSTTIDLRNVKSTFQKMVEKPQDYLKVIVKLN